MYSSLTKPSPSIESDGPGPAGPSEDHNEQLFEKNDILNVYQTNEKIPDLNDPNFQNYLKILNIDPVKEPHLVWIAEEGFVQPLGTEWRAIPTDDGDYYFVNRSTGESKWEHPSDDHYRKMVEEWRSNTVTISKSEKKPISKVTEDFRKIEILSDEEEKIYSSDSVTFGSPEDDTSIETDDEAFEGKDKEFFISSPRLHPNLEQQKSFESSGDERKKVTFSKHLVKIYEFDDGNLHWKRSNLFRKQNPGENEKPVFVKELEDGGIQKDKQTAGQRPGTPLIVPTERYKRLKQVQRRADAIVYRNWREFCTAVTESYGNAYQLTASISSKRSPDVKF